MNNGYSIKVLDKGYVRLVDSFGNDQRIVESARVSYKSPSKGEVQDKKLLKYLWRNRHTSPFEQVSLTYNLKLPLFVQGQLIRHRTFRCNQQSARYSEMAEEFYIPSQWREQDSKNKQGSLIKEAYVEPQLVVPHREEFGHMGENGATEYLEDHCRYSYELYKAMIEGGIAKEMARMVLPQNLYTEIYVNCDVHNLMHFFELRLDEKAQWEIREYAKAMFEIFKELFPWCAEAFLKT